MLSHQKSIRISLLTHAGFLMIFMVSFPDSHTPRDDQRDQQIIASQLINTPLSNPAKTSHASTPTTPQTTAHKSQPNIPHNSKTSPALTALLHTAIQREQQYPASAQEQNREGRVTLSFTLFPDGTITNPRIQHSSGTPSLDQAALTALNTATPFQQVNQYLKTPENYEVNVIFQLN